MKKSIENEGIEEGYKKEKYEERIEYEIGIIKRMKFKGYLMIVEEFIKWEKDNGIKVGKGSG